MFWTEHHTLLKLHQVAEHFNLSIVEDALTVNNTLGVCLIHVDRLGHSHFINILFCRGRDHSPRVVVTSLSLNVAAKETFFSADGCCRTLRDWLILCSVGCGASIIAGARLHL